MVLDRARVLIEEWQHPNQSVLSQQASSYHEQVTVHETYQSTIPSTVVPVTSPVPVKWQSPSNGRLKCNIDASFSHSLTRTGISMCVRDE